MSQQGSKKKKTKIVVWTIILIFVIGIAVLLWTQANNLKALQYAQYTPEERQLLLEQNQERIDAIISSLPVNPLTLLTEEQEEMLQNGDITEEEALQIIMGIGSDAQYKKNGSDKKGSGAGSDVSGKQTGDHGRLQELLARVYLLRSSYTGQLDGLVAQAKGEYIAQRKSGKKVDKTAIASRYISKGLALESSCDGQIEGLLSEIKAELERTGGDTSVVAEIRGTYNTEKSIKKADIMSMYSK